ncbi:MAG TPA: H-X9-DG-CTERM domain-containing protein [Tepidisphaeraceae bacterium]|nr:H-X9-DG-CTERM domain-containing protein [Tepidisphaeraceae bacterium]
MKLIKIISTLIAVLVFTGLVNAQPLADRVPAGALVYMGWHGAGTMPPGYDNTHLKAVLDNSKMRELFTEYAPQLLAKLAQRQPQMVGPINLARQLLAQFWDHPTAFYFAGIDMPPNADPMPKLALICQAGADAPIIREQIAGLLQKAGNSPLHVEAVGDLVVIYLGYPQASAALANGAQSLGQSAAFTASMKQVGSEPMLMAYVDVEKLFATFDEVTKQAPNPQATAMASHVLDVFGLRGLKRVVYASGFDGQDWMTQMFVDAPAPRTGLLDLLDAKPVSADVLKTIPADSTFAATVRFDPARLISRIRELSAQVDPQAQRYIDMGLGAVQVALARNPVTDILEPLGADWAAYCSPSVGGNGALSIVLVNHLDDAAKARVAFPIASVNLSNWTSIALSRARAGIQIAGQFIEIGDQRVFYVGLPIVAPSWAMKDGNLYMALYPQFAASAARWTSTGAKTIAQNEKFQALQKRLAIANPVSFSFYDLPASATQGNIYSQYLMLARYAGFSDLMLGVPVPEPLLPPLDVLSQHLAPAGSVAWVDDAGYHVKTVSPFPGSRMLNEQGMFASVGIGVGGLMTSILLPSLNRARETANRVKCASNLRSIGQAILLYANDNQGKFPPNLGELILKEELTAGSFICPSGNTQLPNAVGPDIGKQIADWVNANSDYVYLGAGKTAAAPAVDIIAYDKPGHHDNDGINILFADGHVDFVTMRQAMQMIAQQAPAGGL